jgi:tetratricopeptide (TPR) repeat protein
VHLPSTSTTIIIMKIAKYALLAMAAIGAVTAAEDAAVPLTTESEAAAATGATEATGDVPKEERREIRCPAQGGTFNELNAVGTVLAGQGSYLAAEACLLDAVNTVIPTFQALTELAEVRGDPLQASARSGIVESLAGTAQARLYHAQRLINANRHGEAVGRLSVLAENNKDVAGVHHLYANALYNSGLREQGITALKEAIKLDEKNEGYAKDLKTLEDDLKAFNEKTGVYAEKAAEEEKAPEEEKK